MARSAALKVVRALRAKGFTAFFAGGCVRDELLGLDPTDYDIATDARPDALRSIFPRVAEVGAAFGVMLVREGRAVVEVATFRADGEYTDRRRPDRVHFSGPLEDAKRRDFTINALFLDPDPAADLRERAAAGPAEAEIAGARATISLLPERPADPQHAHPRGLVIDFVGGRADLDARLLRAVGDADQRLAEDHLRALRAVRFAARLDLAIDPATASAVRRHAVELAGISRERIGDEIRRMFAHPTRAKAAALLTDLALDGPTLTEPSLSAPDAPSRAPSSPLLSRLPPDAPLGTSLAAWALARGHVPQAGEVNDALVRRYRAALCLSNIERDQFADVLRALVLLGLPGAPDEPWWNRLGVAGRKRSAAVPAFAHALLLLELVDPTRAGLIRSDVAVLEASPTGLAPPAFLGGEDLIALGLRPGPEFKKTLDAIYDAQLEGRVLTREQAVALARGLIQTAST
ncbi:MAG: CCA tRNA nucleotidyltransferase [Planctomycetota bacterium]|nr:CCA tRNA nucleotidyltransferase [Planctomycetota bacterium]